MVALAGCGGSDQRPPVAPRQAAQSLVAEGHAVFRQAGCLACHRLGREGNDGPGPDLGGIGSRLPPRAIAGALRNPVAPMPSFARLPRRQFDALVAFLAQQRGPAAAPHNGVIGINCAGTQPCRRLLEQILGQRAPTRRRLSETKYQWAVALVRRLEEPSARRFYARLVATNPPLVRARCVSTAHALSGVLRHMTETLARLRPPPARQRLHARMLEQLRTKISAVRSAASATSRDRLSCGLTMRRRIPSL